MYGSFSVMETHRSLRTSDVFGRYKDIFVAVPTLLKTSSSMYSLNFKLFWVNAPWEGLNSEIVIRLIASPCGFSTYLAPQSGTDNSYRCR